MSDASATSRAPEPVGAYPYTKRAGGFLFLSGVGPRKAGTSDIPGVTLGTDGSVVARDIAAQCVACFENVRIILEEAGVRWDQITDVQVFLTHMKEDFQVFNRLYAQWFAGEGNPNPTRTTMEVGSLPTPIAVELKVIAFVGSGDV